MQQPPEIHDVVDGGFSSTDTIQCERFGDRLGWDDGVLRLCAWGSGMVKVWLRSQYYFCLVWCVYDGRAVYKAAALESGDVYIPQVGYLDK